MNHKLVVDHTWNECEMKTLVTKTDQGDVLVVKPIESQLEVAAEVYRRTLSMPGSGEHAHFAAFSAWLAALVVLCAFFERTQKQVFASWEEVIARYHEPL